jgi:hypothetical protein
MATQKNIKEGLKSGYKSTEFYCSLGAILLGAVVSLGLADPDGAGTWDKVVGVLCTLAAAFGYTISRGNVKAAHEESK